MTQHPASPGAPSGRRAAGAAAARGGTAALVASSVALIVRQRVSPDIQDPVTVAVTIGLAGALQGLGAWARERGGLTAALIGWLF